MKEKATMEGDVQEAPRESTPGLQGGGVVMADAHTTGGHQQSSMCRHA
jgi:hypothetical protein